MLVMSAKEEAIVREFGLPRDAFNPVSLPLQPWLQILL